MKQRLIAWIPPVAWMLMLFAFSSRPTVAVTNEFIADFIILKTLHIIEYAILCFLFFRALYKTSKRSIKEKLAWAVILSLSYAIFDEYHQTLVPPRTGRVRDIFIDTAGIYGMYLVCKYNLDKLKRFL